MDDALTAWLQRFLDRHGAASGTVHLIDGEVMRLAAAVNIPPKVQEITATIPRGKGMGGLAWERGAPVFSCNIQDDRSGDVRPGAKAVAAKAAVAFPHGTPPRVVVGIAWMEERDLDDASVAAITADAADLPS
jgi:L-methionine (R)-S-oxide reductase